jgi:hypothetical protein
MLGRRFSATTDLTSGVQTMATIARNVILFMAISLVDPPGPGTAFVRRTASVVMITTPGRAT